MFYETIKYSVALKEVFSSALFMKFGFSLTSFCILCQILLAEHSSISRGQAYSVLKAFSGDNRSRKIKDNGLKGKIFTGYQGWFRAPGDGSGLGFSHYQKKGKFEPGSCSIDLWPDLTEFTASEMFSTPFRHADGSVAHVFSSLHPVTVDRHFNWMKEYQIDGAFVQRFAIHSSKLRKDFRRLKFENQKLMLCRDAAIKNGRHWALMYDLSGIGNEDFERLAEDWKALRERMQIGTDPKDSAYLHLNGKPLVGIWGVGFNDGREYGLEKTEWLIRLLKHNPDWGGMSILLGVPYYWRDLNRDSVRNPELHKILGLVDVISPWSVGRYSGLADEYPEIVSRQFADRKWCNQKKIDYMPVLFPGFSWKNLNENRDVFIPRQKGKFFMKQFLASSIAGSNSVYIAMFDEMDEGTAVFKCTNKVPVGKSSFETFEGLPSDHYLKICRDGGRMIRGSFFMEGDNHSKKK